MPAVPQRFCTAGTALLASVRPLNSVVRRQDQPHADASLATLPRLRRRLRSIFRRAFQNFWRGLAIASYGVSRVGALPAPSLPAQTYTAWANQRSRTLLPHARTYTAWANQRSRTLLAHIRGSCGSLDRSAIATARSAGPSDALRSTVCRGARRLTTHWSGHLFAAGRAWLPLRYDGSQARQPNPGVAAQFNR
jgi:hypothetical protein